MKKLFFTVMIMAMVSSMIFAQDVLYSAKVKKEKVPTIILESIAEDFPDGTIIEYFGLPVDIVEDVWYVDTNKPTTDTDYDTYSIRISTKSGSLMAMYDKDGNLISEHERLKDVALPRAIQTSIGKHFPSWAVTGDKVIMTSHNKGHKKVHYKVNLRKGDEIFHAVFDANGNLVKGKEHSSHHKFLERKKHLK